MESIDDIKQLIGQQLKERRLELGWTQQELAEGCGLLQPHIARVELFGPGTVSQLLRLCHALDLRVNLISQPAAELVRTVVDAADDIELDTSMEELFSAPPDTPIGRLKNGVCRVHGTFLDDRKRCLVKGCRYG